jgi:hypothetical protein
LSKCKKDKWKIWEDKMTTFDPTRRLNVIINDILPDAKVKPRFYSDDYLFNLQEKAMELADKTPQPLLCSIIIRERFNDLFEGV